MRVLADFFFFFFFHLECTLSGTVMRYIDDALACCVSRATYQSISHRECIRGKIILWEMDKLHE